MKAILTAAFLFLHLDLAKADVTSRLQVHIPKDLSKTGGYNHREALFGVPVYGGSIQQTVYYADQDLCDNVDSTLGFPQRNPDSDGIVPSWPSPFILMVDRGRCTFVKKVRNAQRAGAAGVIIADNKCLCTAGDACEPDDGDPEICETEEPIMADDGSGSDISIPSFLMFKEDADPIKKALKNNKTVRIEMAWALPSSNRKVEYDLFTTPTDRISRSFLDQFKVAAMALGERAKFTPHMYLYDGVIAGCQGFDGENQCGDMCTNSGRYCATEPDGYTDVTGADVVTEALRRSCIWKLYGSDGIGEEWWTYVEEFMYRCSEGGLFANEDCINDAYSNAGVDGKSVEQCMSDSGGVEADSANEILEAQLAEREAAGAVIIPSVYVNAATIRGALTFATIFKAVCAGFESKEEPDVCRVCATCLNEYECVTKGKCTAGGGGLQGGVSNSVFGSTLFGLAFLFFCIGYCQFRRSQALMREEVKGIMAEYMPLDKRNATVDTSVGIPDDDEE